MLCFAQNDVLRRLTATGSEVLMAGGTQHPDDTRDRPRFPEGYGIDRANNDAMLSWDDVSGQLERSRNYWIVTASPSGRPHTAPVWGVWVDGALVFGTDTRSRKALNLEANPRLVVHLESGDDVVILDGTPEHSMDEAFLSKVDDAYAEKYGGVRLTTAPGDPGLFVLRPRVVHAWREKDFTLSATRWRFEV
jgi:hypothetical protein